MQCNEMKCNGMECNAMKWNEMSYYSSQVCLDLDFEKSVV